MKPELYLMPTDSRVNEYYCPQCYSRVELGIASCPECAVAFFSSESLIEIEGVQHDIPRGINKEIL